MSKFKMVIAYDGTDFAGFQRQPGQRTVQGVLEETLTRITRRPVAVTGAGRTDAGVHALGQVTHFESDCPIPFNRWVRVVNDGLPRDLQAKKVEPAAPGFHARKDAYWKRYRYTLDTNRVPNLFCRRFRTPFPRRLELNPMRQAARYLVGTHDFTSLSAARAQVEHRVRTLYHCDVSEDEPGIFTIQVVGDGFLYHMVRILAGTLVEVGLGKRPPDDIPRILSAKDRSVAGKTLPPDGLVMMEVGYTPWQGM
ncbi:MAG: tRNA pseudouridine(38-40) synthase TruA [Firmicutes bacterium]|nr:tRNA pseudouridine(38-40) synthase TruA [Bacillota bacterium]